MDLKEKTFGEMLKESVSYLHENENVWKNLAVIAANVAALDENEQELDHAFKAQDEHDPGGHVAQKNEQLSVFFRKIYKVGRKLSFYAKETGDKVLLNDADVHESTFVLLPEKEALIKCSTILKRGNEYLSKTAAYGITALELNNLTDELSALEKMKPKIGIIMNDRKSARRSIKEVIAEARLLLDKLDDAFEGMIDDDAFIDGWFAVRKIKGRHKPHGKNDKGTDENN
ncbi:MAG: hypothetical protein GZ094_20430 [Mariniphaga sp.]|nr:hypothetical protein [Mariniphaga sp.]